MRMGVGTAVEIGGGMEEAAGIAPASVLRYRGGSLLFDWGEDLRPAWSTIAAFEGELALAMVVWCES